MSHSDTHPGQWRGGVRSTEISGDDCPIEIAEPRLYKTATEKSVQDEGFRVLPIVTKEGLHRCMNFRVAPVHMAFLSASKVCHKGYRIILESEPGQSSMFHKHTNDWIGLREEKGVLFSTVGFLQQRRLAERDRRSSV